MATISTAKDKRNEKEYSIQEIRYLKDNNSKEFEEIKPNLVCYECGTPKMIPRLGGINEHHFALNPKEKHEFDCYYFGDEYSQKEIEKIVSEINNENNKRPTTSLIKNAFDQILTYLNRGTPSDSVSNNGVMPKNKYSENKNFSSGGNEQKVKSRYIPRKKLTKQISDEDIGIWKIYYGKVRVKHSTLNDNFQNFVAYSPTSEKKWQYRISIGIAKNELQECDDLTQNLINQLIKQQSIVNLMILGKITKHAKYNNITVYNAGLLRLFL